MISPAQLKSLTKLRQTLHQYPELSGEESVTIERIIDYISSVTDKALFHRVGKGLLVEFKGEKPGSTTMIRAELDALPIEEVNSMPYRSVSQGKSHKCGHDGHMTMVAGLMHLLEASPLKKGRVILLFQSAEETGQGARWMLEDPAFSPFKPDHIYALHNLPGEPRHQVLLKSSTFCAASVGMLIFLTGKTAHASHPETGISPAGALCRLAPLVTAIPQAEGAFTDFVLVTVTHMELGDPTFGVSPGSGSLWLTLRGHRDQDIDMLKKLITTEAQRIAKEEALQVSFSYHESFDATVNHPEELQRLVQVAETNGIKTRTMESPNRWSEDFGLFLQQSKGAMFGLGSGTEQPALHNPDYDFPDELLETGITMFWGVIQEHNY